MLQSEQDDHDEKFDSKHTKMMLSCLTRGFQEIEITKHMEKLLETKNKEFEELKEKFESTKEELAKTKIELADAEEFKEEQKNIIEKTIGLLQIITQTPKEMFERLVGNQQNFDPDLLEPFSYKGKEYDFGNEFHRFMNLDYEDE